MGTESSQIIPGVLITYYSEDPEIKKKYFNELVDQISSNTETKRENKISKLNKEREESMKNLIDYQKDREEKHIRNKSIQSSLIFSNLKLLNERRQKQNVKLSINKDEF